MIGGAFAVLTSGSFWWTTGGSTGGGSFGLGAGFDEEMGVTFVRDGDTSAGRTDAVVRSGLGPSGFGGMYISIKVVETAGAAGLPADPPFLGFFARSFVN
jgi:hypothetical protein